MPLRRSLGFGSLPISADAALVPPNRRDHVTSGVVTVVPIRRHRVTCTFAPVVPIRDHRVTSGFATLVPSRRPRVARTLGAAAQDATGAERRFTVPPNEFMSPPCPRGGTTLRPS